MKGLLVSVVRLLVGLFYRRVEVSGGAHVPVAGPVLLVANHNNGLVDPMLVMATLPRPVVFVAKSTLWKIPLLSRVLDTLGVVPVIRKVDVAREGEPGGADRNEPSFDRLASVLSGGGVALIFPEGRSHSDPALSPIRTGAARIVLYAGVDVAVVPLGMWFTRKEEFRSDVLLKYGGAPIVPAEGSIEGWTKAIQAGLASVTLNAGSWEEHAVVRAVEAIYGEKLHEGARTLDSAFQSRQLLLEACRVLEGVEPGAVSHLARRARAFERLLARVGLTPEQVDGLPGPSRVLAYTLRSVLYVVIGFPVALLGIVAFFVPYRLCGVIADRALRRPEVRDQLALGKILVGLVFFPAVYALEVWLAVRLWGVGGGLVAAALLPAAGLFALRYLEEGGRDESRLRGLFGVLFTPDRMAFLKKERDALRAECDRLAEVFRGRTVSASDNPRT